VVLPVLLLLTLSLLAISSATHHPESPRHGYLARHVVSIVLGLGCFGLFLFLPARLWEDWAWLAYGVSIFLLIAVLFLGVDEYGARRWFRAGPLRFQPSEFGKLTLVFVLARYLSGKRVDLTRPRHLGAALGLALLPFLLVLKEPDLGTAGAYPGLTLSMLLWAGLPWLTLVVVVSPIITLAVMHYWYLWVAFMLGLAVWFRRAQLSWFLLGICIAGNALIFWTAPHVIKKLEPYQQQRIATFFNPEADPSGAGYQVMQSKIAIGSGRLMGKGYLRGTQNMLAFLPQQHTDFVYSVVGEEWGFLGSFVVIVCFAFLAGRGLYLGRNGRSPFGSLLAVGVTGLICYHAVINMAMTMGLFPVTGLPLPFLSYGGSFMLTMMAGWGLLLNLSVHRYDY
jgi:rod shape determining protein RodA